jgi:hypothetical protein
MPSQRRTLPENRPDTEPAIRYRGCKTCKHSVPASSLLHGECPDCAGLQPLPLRGEGGRFLPGLTSSSISWARPSSSAPRSSDGAR